MDKPDYFFIIKRNRVKLATARIALVGGIILLSFDIYIIWFVDFWYPPIFILAGLSGFVFLLLAWSGRFRRFFRSYKKKDDLKNRKGRCNNCGACCKLPISCVFHRKGKCMIWKKRFRQCRDFPSGPDQMVSYECGYWFD